jgi:hypothetical protein
MYEFTRNCKRINKLIIVIIYYKGVWAEGSAFRLQIEIKGFEFPELLYHRICIYVHV